MGRNLYSYRLYLFVQCKRILTGIITILIMSICISLVMADPADAEIHSIIAEKVVDISDFVQNGTYKNYVNNRIGCGIWVYNSKIGDKENGDTYFALLGSAATARFSLCDVIDGASVKLNPNSETTPIVWSMNVYPNNSVSTIKFQTNGSLNIANDISADMLECDRWNNLTLIYYSETEGVDKHTDLYINGEYISSKELSYNTAVYGTEFRFTIEYVDYTQNSSFFIDDVKFYRISEFERPILTGENFEIKDHTIYNYPKVTVGEFTEMVTIPKDTVLEVIKTDGNIALDTDRLSSGMIVKVQYKVDGLGTYSASYRLSPSKIHTVAEFADENSLQKINVIRATKEIAYNIGGKAGAACKLSATELSSDGARTMFTNIPITEENKADVMVISVQLYVNDTVDAMYFATNSHAPLSEYIYTSALEQDKWNKLTLIYNPDYKMSKLYINDKYISSITRAIGNTLRLVINVGAAEFGDGSIYYDDFVIHAGALTYPFVTAEGLVLDGTTINGYGDKTASEFIAACIKANEEYEITVCSPDGTVYNAKEGLKEKSEVRVWAGDVLLDKYYIGVPNYKASEFVQVATNGYISEKDKFGKGTVTVTRDFDSYTGNMEVTTIVAQYSNNGVLQKVCLNKQNLGIGGKAMAEIEIEDNEDSYIKFMILDFSTLKPLCDSRNFAPYSNDKIESAARLFEGYTTKTAVFNYDDCRAEDIRFIELLNRYGMKGTFNLTVNHIYSQMKAPCYEATGKNDAESVYNFARSIYKDHEVSNHTVNHYPAGLNPGEISFSSSGVQMTGVSTEEEIADITGCIDFLQEKFNVTPIGLAWPSGYGTFRNDYESDLLPAMQENGVRYARGAETGTFAMPYDWYIWNPSCHHKNALAASEGFISLKNKGDLKCLFIWGHTYEFDQNASDEKRNWNMIENVMKSMQTENIWFATNAEIYKYVEATKLVEVTDTVVTNNSDMTVYYNINGVNTQIASGETYSILEN